MKITSIVAVSSISLASFSFAFTPVLPLSRVPSCAHPNTRIFSSQWEEEDEEVATEKPKSFDDAGESLKNLEDKTRMDGMSDYDANPAYNRADIDRVREAIKQRTEALGIEKSKISAQAIEEAKARAQAQIANRAAGGMMLDLSQISQTAPRGQDDDEIPAMFYEPENEMTEEEMIEADPVGQLPIPQQVLNELQAASWPTPGAALREVIVLIVVVVATAALIIQWDSFLREFYTNFGFIPRPEDIMSGGENMVLPEGWTNNMSEEDFMKFQDEIGKVATSSPPVDTAFPDSL